MEKINILLGMPEELLLEVEKYRNDNKIKTRTRALLELIKKGLQA